MRLRANQGEQCKSISWHWNGPHSDPVGGVCSENVLEGGGIA